jgi:anti-sigma factor RsiW
MHCKDLEHVVVPFVDGEAPAPDRVEVEAHLAACPPCRQRVTAERIVREALVSERDRLRETAPAALRSRCAALRSRTQAHHQRHWFPLSLAAAAVLLLTLGWFGTTDAGTPVLAAQLTLDHVKCFKLNSQRVTGSPTDLAAYWRDHYGWPIVIPPAVRDGLHLAGLRRCGSSDGQTAHIMYKYNGRPVSLFVARHSPDRTRTERTVRVFGEEAVVWSTADRTYVLVGDESRMEMETLASLLRKEIPTR